MVPPLTWRSYSAIPLSPRAVGKRHGASYLESWKVAFESRPKFIQIHQWNEYAEQYNLEFSDEMEPTALDKCGYRGCGGWGYYYMNLTKALISLYRKETPDITVLALSGPIPSAVVKKSRLFSPAAFRRGEKGPQFCFRGGGCKEQNKRGVTPPRR